MKEMTLARLERSVRGNSTKIARLQGEIEDAVANRDRLLLQGVQMNVPRQLLADWAGIRRESVYVAALRANQNEHPLKEIKHG